MTTRGGKYVVWARGYAEIRDTREKAFTTAYYIHNSDHNWVDHIEGPDSDEDLDGSPEYKAWERAYEEELAKEEKENPTPKATHKVSIQSVEGNWRVVEWVYPPDYKYVGKSLEEKRDKWVVALGNERVKVETVS